MSSTAGIVLLSFGAVAQLAERFHGMEEVRGSIPLSSTNRSCEQRVDPCGGVALARVVGVHGSPLLERASHSVTVLRRLNVVTLGVAIAVYVVLLAIAAYHRLLGLAVFSSCVMLAEALVFQLVRTVILHLDLVRRP